VVARGGLAHRDTGKFPGGPQSDGPSLYFYLIPLTTFWDLVGPFEWALLQVFPVEIFDPVRHCLRLRSHTPVSFMPSHMTYQKC